MYLLCCDSFVELFGLEWYTQRYWIYGCDLIQESGILLKLYPVFLISLYVRFMKLFTFLNFVGSVCYLNLCTYRPEAVATGQVLFHRFYCKKSFGRFNVKVKFCLLSFSLYIENKCRKEKCSLKCVHDVLIVGIMVKFTVS